MPTGVFPAVIAAALRETSIVFAMATGARPLGERPGRVSIVAAGPTLLGAVLLRRAA